MCSKYVVPGVLADTVWNMAALAWPEIWGTVAAIATSAILLGSAVAAFLTYRNARSLREAQTRPWVVLDFDTPVDPILVDLSIRNIGPTVARNVSFSSDPELESTFDSETRGRGPLRAWTIIDSGIPTLPPGREYRMLFDRGPDRLDAQLPNSYVVTLSYDGPTGQSYDESQVLDLSPLIGMESVNPKRIHDIGKELESIRKTLDKIERHLRA